jgi:UDP-2,3-diacylglucosamine pyrophosphatase LpxH
MIGEKEARHLRALFIFDVHLGTRGCQADLLLDFLRYHEAETIYPVGDVVDGWRLKRAWNWPQMHNDAVQKLLRKAREGVRIMYVPDNYDEFLRTYFATHFGDSAYVMALAINTHFNRLRRKRGFSFWSLSSWAKMQVKNAVSFIGAFEAALVGEANKLGVDGVVCGHIHYAVIHDRAGVGYMNCGDWVESCTALAESHDGSFEIIRRADNTVPPTAPEKTESEHQAAA